MFKFSGTSVSRGIAIAKSICIDFKSNKNRVEIKPSQVTEELLRLETALNETKEDIDHILMELTGKQGEKEILSTHKMILDDPEMQANIKNILRKELVTLESALDINLQSIEKLFSQMDDDYLAARFLDYQDVTDRLIKKLSTQVKSTENWENHILVAKDITPSQVLEAYKRKAAGLLSLNGSSKSHTAILARSLMIPCIVDIKAESQSLCPQTVIMDGASGEIIISPDENTIDKYNSKKIVFQKNLEILNSIADKPAQTKNGKRVPLYCNMEIPQELLAINKLNVDGIGLFRTEFLYLDRDDLPGENEQFEIYRQVAQAMSPRPVIIRTIDLGGDKVADSLCETESNPNLGLRGIRLSFKFKEIFTAQIKAILRASAYGNIGIMFPMISSEKELIKAKKMIDNCMSALDEGGIEYDKNIKIGSMIEVPSAAIRADKISAHCDFLSIGTNDLVQYTLATDRNNDLVADYYNEIDPAVLILIKRVCQAAHRHNIKVSVCGEMASQEDFTALLLGLGVDQLSATSANFSQIKKTILELDTDHCKKYAETLIN